MTKTYVAKPSPHAEGLAKPYWEGSARGVLVLQRCAACGKVRHYPQLTCTECYSDACDWIEATGLGEIHSWTICHHAFHPGFSGDVPYALVTVDLKEDVRALGRWGLPGGEGLQLGLPVTSYFSAREDGFGDLTFQAQ
jgi:uncharacterized OB-fold protein